MRNRLKALLYLTLGILVLVHGRIFAQSTQCPQHYTLNPYNVNVCTSSVTLTLSGSQSGVSYQLNYGGTNVGYPVNGNGGPITLGTVTTGGNYYVYATNYASSCGTIIVANSSIYFASTSTGSPGSVAGTTQAVSGSTYTYSVNAASNAVGYSWTLSDPSAGSITNNGTSASIAFTSGYIGNVTVNCTAIGGCSNTAAGGLTVSLLQPLSGVSVSPPYVTLWSGDNAGTLSASAMSGGNGGYGYQWQLGDNFANWSNIGGANSSTYSPGTVTSSAFYRVVVSSGWESTVSNSVSVGTYAPVTGGSVSASVSAINYNTNGGVLTTSGQGGGNNSYTYQWQSAPDNYSFTNIAGQTGNSYYPGNLTATTYYRVVATSQGRSAASSSVGITVYPQLNAGSITPFTTQINYNTSPGTLSVAPTGGNGSYTYQWQSTPTRGGGTDISGATGPTYNPGNLTANVYYRVNISSNGVNVSTDYASVGVYPTLYPGSITSASASINYNTDPGVIATAVASGGSGVFAYQWQSSPNGSSWSDIPGVTASTYDPGNMTNTTYFRRAVNSNGVVVYTNAIAITVYPPLVAGSVGPSNQTINYNTSAATITSAAATGGNGTYTYQWQSAPDGTTWANITGAGSTSYAPGTLTATRYYRLISTSNGVNVTGGTAQVVVYPQLVAGSISPTIQVINYNTTAGTITGVAAVGGNGTYTYQWQSSPDGTNSWTNITSANSLSYNPGTLTANGYYHLIATSNGVSTTSATAQVTVYPQLVSGTLTPLTQGINYNTTAATITSIAATGGNSSYTYQWQKSPDGSTSWTNITGANSLAYSPGIPTATTYYHLISTSNGANATSATAQVTVYPPLAAGAISPLVQNINYNTTAGGLTAVIPTGGNGTYGYQWQMSIDGSTFTNITAATSLTYSPGTLTATRYYHLISTSNGVSVTSSTAQVTVYPPLVAGTVSPLNQAINYNTPAAILTGLTATGGGGGYTYQWQSSPDGTSSWTNISGATSLTYSSGNLTASIYYHLVSTSNGVSITSSTAQVTVYPQIIAGSVTPLTQTINFNTAGGLITSTAATGGNGTYLYQWQSSPNGSNTWVNIVGATGPTYLPGTLTTTTYYHLISTSNGSSITGATALVTVNPQLVAGTVSPAFLSINYNTSPGTLTSTAATVSGGTTVYQWQSSPSGTDNWTNITGANSLTYTPGNLISTTYYRMFVTNNGFTANSNVSVISIYAPLPASNLSADVDKNWILTRSYDDNGNEIGTGKQFFDYNGQGTQAQTRNESSGQVLATQTIYDFQGRPALTTLAAPISNTVFAYSNNFVTSGGNNYTYTNFDGDPTNTTNPYAKLNTPDAVDNTTQGTLGWYYSNNNTFEPQVATTSFPYSRLDFYHDGTGETKRTAGVGEPLKMGTGHETTNNGLPVQNELNAYVAVRNQFFPSTVIGAVPTSMAGQGLMSVSNDENGTSVMSVFDLTGKNTLMTARADANGWLAVQNTLQLSNVAPGYSLALAADPGGASINSLSISSNNLVTVICVSCIPVTYQTDYGNNYVYSGTGSNSYILTSAYPFDATETLFVAPLQNPVVLQYDQATARLNEGSSSTIKYFRLTSAGPVTFTGTYTLYNMTTESDVTASYPSGSTLPAGYYKVTATPAPATFLAVNNVTVTYTNKYSDISFNYYNQLGQLVASVAPNGVQTLISAINGGTLSSISSLPFTTTYEYNLLGRLTASTSPDGGRTEFAYRTDGNIRISQNALQRTAANGGRFSYTNYDAVGRPIESGEYVPQSATDVQFTTAKTNSVLLESTAIDGGITGGVKQYQVKTHYDAPDNSHGLAAYIQDQGFIKGAVSWTENANSKTWYNYDDQGRVTWMIKQITGLGNKTINYTYDALSNVTKVDFQKETAGERFIHYYTYDGDGRLTNVQTSRDDVNKLQQAKYYYYLHGPLKRTELGDQLQGNDYLYTAQGWLKSMNSSAGDPLKDPGHDGSANSFAADAFGMQLEYFPNDYVRSGVNVSSISTGQQYYNGNVTGLSWQTQKNPTMISNAPAGVQNPTMYAYNYDSKYQLTNASWGTPNFTTAQFTSVASYKEAVSNYDANGNITGLQRNNQTGALVDDFSKYNYQAGTNKLLSVGNAASPNGFGTYTYDALGQLTSAQEADKASTAIYPKYDVAGKIVGIYSDAGLTQQKLGYNYDESGKRISRTDYTGSQPVTSYYVYDAAGNSMAIYTGTTLTEMPFYGSDRLGTYNVSGNSYAYELKDNVGSIRAVINRNKNATGQADIQTYTDYYPFGSIARRDGTTYRYDYQGAYAEKDNITNWNNFDLRMYDSRIGRWLGPDPKKVGFTPYNGMGNNPVSAFDKDGGDPSTFVTANTDGTYTVVGGILDNDLNVYVVDDASSRSKAGEIIGRTLTQQSFYNSDIKQWMGNINPNDMSGINFLNGLERNTPSLTSYMANAYGGQKYDFKRNGVVMGSPEDNPNYYYRGMMFSSIAYSGDKGQTTFASARDFGNFGAGYIAGKYGLSWGMARLGFNFLQSFQDLRPSTEGSSTQMGERAGWLQGGANDPFRGNYSWR
jgi:RHS repeat-associated protein